MNPDAHGQLSSRTADGSVVLSAHKLVELGARAQLLIVPGLFRFDARPEEDSLQVMTRALGDDALQWQAEDNPPGDYGARDEAVYHASWRFSGEAWQGRVQLATTLDVGAHARHFALHAVIRERGRMRP